MKVEWTLKSYKNKETSYERYWHRPSKSEDLPTWVIENIQAFFKSSWMSLSWPEPKMFGKEENGVSTPLVLSMRPYAHIIAKHAKKGHLV